MVRRISLLTVSATRDWYVAARDRDDRQGMMHALHVQALIAAWSDDEARATSVLVEKRAFAAELGPHRQEAITNIPLGAQAARRGDYAHARALLEDALAVLRELGDELNVGQALCIIGIAAVLEGDYAAAREPLERSLEIAQRFGYPEAFAYSLSGLAGIAAGEGDLERAENLLAAADVLLAEVGATRLPLVAEVDGRTRTTVLAARGPESFDAALERMRTTNLEQIVVAAHETP
jgi:tetratricopeptide (TPR) repeat protein